MPDETIRARPSRRAGLRNAGYSLLALLTVFLLFQNIATGNRWLDLLLFQTGCRLVALGLIAWFIVCLVRRRGRGAVVGVIGAGMFIFGAWGGARFLAVLSSRSADSRFYGLDVNAWWAAALLEALFVVLIVVGLLLMLHARRRLDREGRS